MDASLPQPRWQVIAGWAFAIFLSILLGPSFRTWKLGSPIDWAARLIQFTVPGELATPATLAVGIAELFGGVLILVPRFRRWGGWLLALLLAVFMLFVGIKYKTLVGARV